MLSWNPNFQAIKLQALNENFCDRFSAECDIFINFTLLREIKVLSEPLTLGTPVARVTEKCVLKRYFEIRLI